MIYSNTNYNLLAEIISRVTEVPFETWIQREVFEPLNMTNSFFKSDYQQVVINGVTSYSPGYNSVYNRQTNNLSAKGSSSLHTTSSDLIKWVRNFSSGILGGKELVESLYVCGRLNNGEENIYASGLFVENYKGMKEISHSGGWAGFRTRIVMYPDIRLSVILLCNTRINPTVMINKITNIIYPSFLTGDDVEVDVAIERDSDLIDTIRIKDINDYSGHYYSEELKCIYSIYTSKGVLFARIDHKPAIELSPTSEDRFVSKVWWFKDVNFGRDDNDRVVKMEVSNDRVRNMQFIRVDLGKQ